MHSDNYFEKRFTSWNTVDVAPLRAAAHVLDDVVHDVYLVRAARSVPDWLNCPPSGR